ncbi:unnamed protein product [Linum tenue]|uniref:PsbP C-terminal domain-containing protein n=1 Tax=Linum tenue TaxID=586396 RepID=A0AAV0MB65_9ROSI|nr:unnamed protein product [Linum tenue]
MAVASSLSMSLVSTAAAITKRVPVASLSSSPSNDPSVSFSSEPSFLGESSSNLKRRQLIFGLGGTLTTSTLIPLNSASGEGTYSELGLLQFIFSGLVFHATILMLLAEMMKKYQSYVDLEDGYSYIYPSDWRDFDFRGHDSAFKDRYLQIQNVRVRFIPTKKKDIHELGPMEQVISDLISKVYAAPTQRPTIYSMEEVGFVFVFFIA